MQPGTGKILNPDLKDILNEEQMGTCDVLHLIGFKKSVWWVTS